MNYQSPYLNPHQSRTREPTDWELELAAVMEAAFSKGAYELDALVAELNASRVRPRGGGNWTPEKFTTIIAELGA